VETGHIISKDGSRIGYKKTGTGDALIIVHGGGRMAGDYERLAMALADMYTVYTYDRRGRGDSDAITEDHCIERECDDLISLIKATGAEKVFGHSMGAIIALEASCRVYINNIALYEPPVQINNSVPTGFMDSFNRAVHNKQYERAMAISLKGLQMHEAARLPVWLLVIIIKLMRAWKPGKGKDWKRRMAQTLPTMQTDMAVINTLNNSYGKYKKIRSLALLMGGSKSPAYLLQPLDLLKSLMPYARVQLFPGYYHVAPEEQYMEIADTLKQFFK